MHFLELSNGAPFSSCESTSDPSSEAMVVGTPSESTLSSAQPSGSVCDGLSVFRACVCPAGDDLQRWCLNFAPVVRRMCKEAKQLLQVNLLWRQPTLLRVPKNYDEIFQVLPFHR
jgi:hypothetical protein